MNRDQIERLLVSCIAGLIPGIAMWPVNSDATMESVATATGIIVFLVVLVANELSHQIDELRNSITNEINSLKKAP